MHLYILIMNYQKKKLREQSHLELHQKKKVPRNKFNQGGGPYLTSRVIIKPQ